MASRLATLLRHDTRLQSRYGIYAAYSVVVALYAAMIYFIGAKLPGWVVALTIATDPSVLGFFFLGGLMLLEKAEASRTALAMTPVTAGEYLAAKTITLTGVALVAVTVMGALFHGDVDWPVYLLTVVLLSAQFTGIGAVFALRFKTVTGYLIGSAGLMLPLILPGLLAVFPDMPIAAAMLPFAAPLRLLLVALGTFDAAAWEIAVMLVLTLLYAVAGQMWGRAALRKELGIK